MSPRSQLDAHCACLWRSYHETQMSEPGADQLRRDVGLCHRQERLHLHVLYYRQLDGSSALAGGSVSDTGAATKTTTGG